MRSEDVNNSSNEVCSQHDENIIAGRLKQFSSAWESITSDKYILEAVKSYKIEFVDNVEPCQTHIPWEIDFNAQECDIIDQEIAKLLKKGVVINSQHEDGEFISNIFLRRKKDGNYRMILNLKHFNEYVSKHHFKMESLQSAVGLMKPGCYMATVDLKDAYYSVPIDRSHQKFIKFSWKGRLFQFTCLPNGLSCAPRCFTKILKPVYATLRRAGHVNVGYIDDQYLQGDTKTECRSNIGDTVSLLTKLGFLIHPDKSVLVPVQRITFLGFILDSILMLVMPTPDKVQKLKSACGKLLSKPVVTVQELAEVIGIIVSNFPGVEFGPLFYRSLERDKNLTLKHNKGDFSSTLQLSPDAIADLNWWCKNIESATKGVTKGNPDIVITTDASTLGWGAVLDKQSIGGQWTQSEACHHINYLELLATFLALKSFCKDMSKVHVRLRSDNTTTVAYLNSMGGMQSILCDTLAKEIWLWCIQKQLWLSASHVPGKDNIQADRASRHFDDNTEWMLHQDIFLSIEQLWGKPEIDLFASRLNKQHPCYVSWKPVPGASFTDAFTISWSDYYFYAFPPFSIILRCLQKIEQEEAEGILVVPNWPTQPWYSKLMQMIIDHPRLLPVQKSILSRPSKAGSCHPLWQRLHLMACKLSGQPCKTRAFLKRQQTSFLNHGDQEHANNINHISHSGYNIVIKGVLIRLTPLWDKH